MNSMDKLNSALSTASNVASNGKSEKSLKQGDFLKLLVSQLKHQDPMKPQDNAEFVAQMAQFGTVDGIQKLQSSFSDLAVSLQSNQALQASTMVGRKVQIESNIVSKNDVDPVKASVNLENGAKSVQVFVKDLSGQVVKTINLPAQQPGNIDFQWDGTDQGGKPLPAGQYAISAVADMGAGNTGVPTLAYANVDSVTLGQGGSGLILNLAGLGSVHFGDVLKIV